MQYTVELATDCMNHMPGFMMIVLGVQAVLKFCLSNLRDCSVGVTDGSDL
jgi:hypothetical protein